jgi:hypothetical protein
MMLRCRALGEVCRNREGEGLIRWLSGRIAMINRVIRPAVQYEAHVHRRMPTSVVAPFPCAKKSLTMVNQLRSPILLAIWTHRSVEFNGERLTYQDVPPRGKIIMIF